MTEPLRPRTAAGRAWAADNALNGAAHDPAYIENLVPFILAIEAEAADLAAEGLNIDWHYCDLDSPHHLAAVAAEKITFPAEAASDLRAALTDAELTEIEGHWAAAYGSLDGETHWSSRAVARLLDEVRSHARGLCYVLWPGGPNGEQLACGFRRGHDGVHSWAWVPSVIAVDRRPWPSREPGEEG